MVIHNGFNIVTHEGVLYKGYVKHHHNMTGITMHKLEIRYSGFFKKLAGFSLPDWPEATMEINPPTGGTHLLVISNHPGYLDLSAHDRNAIVAAALRKEGVVCPDDVVDKWPHLERGNF
jgi:hypothetical protein